MPTYIVDKREVWTQMVEVEASDPDSAKELVANGGGTTLDQTLEYSHDLPTDHWTVEVVSEETTAGPDWKKFQSAVVGIVDGLDDAAVPMKSYAQTYARHILANIHEGEMYGSTAQAAAKQQMLYVVSNLDGASEEVLRQLERLSAELGVDISGIVSEILSDPH